MSSDKTAPRAFPGIYRTPPSDSPTVAKAGQIITRGSTANFKIRFDNSIATGTTLADGLLASCEADYAFCLQNFFGLSSPPSGGKFTISIVPGSSGASHSTCGSRDISVDAFDGTDVELVRMNTFAEVTEVLMSVVGNWDCGASTGEGLSRVFCFELHPDPGSATAAGFHTAMSWLAGGRPDFVTKTDPTDLNFVSTGCATLFIYFLHYQLGFSWTTIVAAGGKTLADTFHKLTGRTDALAEFTTVINKLFPAGQPVPLMKTDNPFPIPSLKGLTLSLANVVAGHNPTLTISLQRPFPAFDLKITLASSNPSVASLPSSIVITAGSPSVAIPVATSALPAASASLTAALSATLLGSTVSTQLLVRQPLVQSVVLSPSSVLAGQTAKATVTMEATYPLQITLLLVSDSPGFATVPKAAFILAGLTKAYFDVTTPPSAIPFVPAKVDIQASYIGGSAFATLQVSPTVVAGTIQSLQLNPASVSSGNQTTGIVTLMAAVSTDTTVGLAALEPGHGPLGPPSTIASVTTPLVIKAGQTQGTFIIKTVKLQPGATIRTATIMATAVVSKTALLTLT